MNTAKLIGSNQSKANKTDATEEAGGFVFVEFP
jgi:hypothetical protein